MIRFVFGFGVFGFVGRLRFGAFCRYVSRFFGLFFVPAVLFEQRDTERRLLCVLGFFRLLLLFLLFDQGFPGKRRFARVVVVLIVDVVEAFSDFSTFFGALPASSFAAAL